MAFVLFHCDCVGVNPCPETDSQGLQITSHFSFPFNSDKGTGTALYTYIHIYIYIYISASKTCSLYQAVWRPYREAWACCGRWASGLTKRPERVVAIGQLWRLGPAAPCVCCADVHNLYIDLRTLRDRSPPHSYTLH